MAFATQYTITHYFTTQSTQYIRRIQHIPKCRRKTMPLLIEQQHHKNQRPIISMILYDTWRMAFTTTILNSSAISFMKEEICFISRSTEPSDPVVSSVVMASVAIDLHNQTFCFFVFNDLLYIRHPIFHIRHPSSQTFSFI